MRFATVFLAFLLTAGAATAQEQVVLEPNRDTTMFEESGSASNGAGIYLFTGKTNQGNDRRALLAFEFSSIPAGATITDAILSLRLSKTVAGATTVSLHRVTSPWEEGTSDAAGQEGTGTAATGGDATWTHAVSGGAMWTNPGGDYDPVRRSLAIVGDASMVGMRFEWPGGTTLAEDIQSWIDQPSGNHGWILITDDTGSRKAKRFDSAESSQANRPTLTVSYTVATAVEETPDFATPTLSPNFPNPFSQSTEMSFTIPSASQVSLEIYDLLGRRVETLVSGSLAAGVHTALFDADGQPTGIYIARLRVGGQVYTRQMARIQ